MYYSSINKLLQSHEPSIDYQSFMSYIYSTQRTNEFFSFRDNLSNSVISQKKWKQDYILDNESYFPDNRVQLLASPSKTTIDCLSNKPDIAGWDV